MFKRKQPIIFSQGMVMLEKEVLKEKESNLIKNTLACIMLEMTKNLSIAKRIVTNEKEIINNRECEDGFLFEHELIFEDVVSYFYDNTTLLENDKREFNIDLTVSELLLLIGVFESILNGHVDIREKKECEYSKLVSKTTSETELKKDELLIQIRDENIFISHLNKIVNMLLEKLTVYLGLESKDSLFLEDFNLSKAIKININKFPLLKREVNRHENSSLDSIDEDLLLLYSCGDNSKSLLNTTKNSIAPKEKIFK